MTVEQQAVEDALVWAHWISKLQPHERSCGDNYGLSLAWEVRRLRAENAELLNAVKRLHPFASSYSTHHLRNPNDKLGEVLDLVGKWI